MATATAALARATPVASQRGTAAFHEITLEDTPPSSDDITSISRLLRGREAEGLADENNPVYAASRSISSAASSSSVKSKYFRLPGAAAPDASSVVLKRVANAPTRIESSELEKTARPTKRKSITIAQSESRRRRTAEDAGCTGAKKHSNAPGEKTMNKKGADDAVLTSKITKPSMGSRSTKPAKTRYLSPPRLVAPSEGDLVQPDQSLGIDRSIIRRRDWTPVKDSICIIASSNEPSLVAHDAHDPGASAPHVRATFTALGDTYGFTGPVAAQDSARTPPTATATTRRRRVELVQNSSAREPKTAAVTKPARKKPRTITEKATELYRSATDLDQQVQDLGAGGMAEPQPRRSTKSKPWGSKKQARASSGQHVLHPNEAIEIWNQQDIVFGTCSQLVREDSPTLIRNLQQALHESADEASQTQASGTSCSFGAAVLSRNASQSRSSKTLWTAAARDNDGSLLEADFIDLTQPSSGSPALNLTGTPRLFRPAATTQQTATMEVEPQTLGTAEAAAPREDVGQRIEAMASDIDRGSIASTRPVPAETTSQKRARKEQTRRTPENVQMPDYDSWSDLDLKAAISRYGFKAIKSRRSMVKKLQKCWEAQHPETALRPAPPAAEAGRGDKTAAAAPAPSHPPGTPPVAAPGATTQPAGAPAAATASGPPDTRAFLFAKIQEAVVHSAPSHDAASPSWHEKILLYDPVVLEDLTVWLNTVGLARVGVDDEVAPSFVRDWCEAQSICCLWRLNFRGAERVQF